MPSPSLGPHSFGQMTCSLLRALQAPTEAAHASSTRRAFPWYTSSIPWRAPSSQAGVQAQGEGRLLQGRRREGKQEQLGPLRQPKLQLPPTQVRITVRGRA